MDDNNSVETPTKRDRRAEHLKPYRFTSTNQPANRGRPKDPGITKLQIKMLDKPCPHAKKEGTTWRQWLAERGLIMATQKERALEDLKDRLEGKVPTPVEISGQEDRPLKIEFIETPLGEGEKPRI